MSDITKWLEQNGFGAYATTFVDNAIDVDVLPHLSDDDLKELGLPLGHRRKLQAALQTTSVSAVSLEQSSDAEPASPAGAERRQLTVMFCDLVGSTSLSARFDPEVLSDIVRGYQDACAGVISRYEGYVARYMGDGMLVYFGYPHAHEDAAERALRAGLSILERVRRLETADGLRLQTRIGVATGLVVVGETVGQASSREQVVMGETPNLAARLQAIAEPDELVIADSTRHLAPGVFEFCDLGEFSLKGFDEVQRAWRVAAVHDAESRFEAHRSSRTLPLVGREQELDLLLERWRQARLGEGQMVLLTGEAGIGKSRISQALLDAVAAQSHVRVRYQCSPYHQDSPLYPTIQHLSRAASITGEESNDEALDKLDAMLAKVGKPSLESTLLFATLLGLDGGNRYGETELNPQRQRSLTLGALVGQLQTLAEQSPVLWVVEDMHWIDPTTLELIEASLDPASSARIMILATARPTFEHGFGGHPIVTRLTLNRLGRRQVDEIATQLGGGKRLPASLLSKIVERTDGVPLFVEELTKTVLESGFLKENADAFELTGEVDRLELPSSLHDSLMARLDRQKPLKEVAQIAACIGREFSCSMLAAISTLDDRALDQALDGLMQAELIFRRGTVSPPNYVFKHALVRDAAKSAAQ